MTRVLLTLGSLGVAASALAFTAFRDPNRADAIRWSAATVQVSLQQDGSDDISDGSDLEALRQALGAWSTATTGLTLQEGPLSGEGGDSPDGVNRISFEEGSWSYGADSALGVTVPHVTLGDPSTFTDVDIVLNGTDGPWTVNGDPMGIDIRSVATHEIGHLLGLWHGFQSEAVMYFGARAGTTFRRNLAQDDTRGAAFVTGGSLSCGGDEDCPLLVGGLISGVGGDHLRLTCQGGSCLAGSAGYGAECLSGGDCSSGQCLDDSWSGNSRDPGACTRACTAGAGDCPGGDPCKDFGGSSYCVPGRGCLEDSDCGSGVNDVCLFDFDGRYRCRRLCMMDSHCGGPGRCIDLGYGAGVCLDPGVAPNGVACVEPLGCAGLACRGSAAQLTCQTAPSVGDGGSLPDVPVVGDGGWRPDAGGVDRGGGAGDGGASEDASGGGSERVQVPPDGQGCACAGSPPERAPLWEWLGAAVLLLRYRRRRRQSS